MIGATLDAHLKSFTKAGGDERQAVARAILHLANAALKLKKAIAEGSPDIIHGVKHDIRNESGDQQHALDLYADELFLDAAKASDAAFYASEERAAELVLNAKGTLAIAVDPLDGSSNIDTNLSIGTIFSILPARGTAQSTFLQAGRAQLAAGFFIYGPQFSLALTLGQGTHLFTFSKRLGAFVESGVALDTPPSSSIFAINMSNYRHWDEAVRLYVDDCLQGEEGVRGRDFNMRWNASLVAEAFRILRKGGIYIYPRDERQGYGSGRLRLVYEGNPIAMLMEQAGAAATDGQSSILDILPVSLHQHIPLVFGSHDEVETVARYQASPSAIGARHPLFGQRGLFRA